MNPLTIPKTTVLAAVLAFAGTDDALAADRLSPEEVRETFIGTPWHSDSGAFIFRGDGTYSYWRLGKDAPRGTWRYRMLEDGVLRGYSTDYKFYRREDGSYFYYHSRSNRNYDAYPNKSFP